MAGSRRNFLMTTSWGLVGAAAVGNSEAQTPTGLPPGAPPAFDTGPL
jgi:hypothetical protein